ncbi:MAG: extracellular solute-binding protein [Clostridia bacterium]|nr:extracellular solute-binding protein [Clostridia bacterium]
MNSRCHDAEIHMKKSLLKPLSSLILAALMMLGSFAACSTEDGGAQTPSDDTAVDQTAADTTAAPEETELVYAADIPSGTNYNGYNFRVAVADLTTIVWCDTDFSILEPSADIVENAVYERKTKVEGQLGVEITPVYYLGDVANEMSKSIQADENAFDIGFAPPKFSGARTTEGWFLDLNNFPNIDLSDPWWDQNSVEDLSIKGKLFTVAGDIGYNYKRSTSVLFFNKKLIETKQLENPYDLVNNNQWTLDKLFEMADNISEDLNGDSAISPADDLYGFANCPDTLNQMMVGAGVNVTEFDSEGTPTLCFMDERTTSVFEKITTFIYDDAKSFNWEAVGVNAGTKFTNDQLLFMPTEFWVITTYRDMATDFGVLPMPKYDASQENYGHIVNAHVAALLMIPRTNTDNNMTGHVVSALGAEGKNLITPAYYEVALKTKMSRDTESEAMFDIIFNSIDWNAGVIYNWGGFMDTTRSMVGAKNTDIASTYERMVKRINKDIEKVLEAYSKLG